MANMVESLLLRNELVAAGIAISVDHVPHEFQLHPTIELHDVDDDVVSPPDGVPSLLDAFCREASLSRLAIKVNTNTIIIATGKKATEYT